MSSDNQTDIGLTTPQRLIWGGQQLTDEKPIYNMAMLFEITGGLDVNRLTHAFVELVRCTETLRTVVRKRDEQPVMHVLPDPEFSIPVVDLSGENQEKVFQWAEQRASREIDLASCNFDSAILKLPGGGLAWYFNQHHLFVDITSMANIHERLSDIYLALERNDSVDASVTDVPYSRFADYEAEVSQSEMYAEAGTFWGSRSWESAVTGFYGRFRGDAVTDSERINIENSASRNRAIEEMINTPGFTSFSRDIARLNLLATAYCAWLHRISRSDGLCIGIPVHNRRTGEFQSAIGLFMELFPLQCHLQEDDTFRSLHQRIGSGTMDLLRNAQPGASNPDLARQFPVVLNYIRATFGDFAGSACSPHWIHSGHIDAGHAVRMQVLDMQGTGSFDIYLDFNLGWFSVGRLDEFAGHFVAVLDAMLDNPDSLIEEVPLAKKLDKGSLDHWYAPVPSKVVGSTVLDRFREMVKQFPDRTAIVDGDTVISFRELDQHSSMLANQLMDSGQEVGRVGVHCTRSATLVTSVLAILRIGAAFIPLEKSFPAKRLRMILRRAGANLVIADNGLLGEPYSENNHPVAIIRPQLVENSESMDPDRMPPVKGEHLAYILFTSGSTGEPKGVMVSHAGLDAYIGWAIEKYTKPEETYAAGSAFPFHTPFGFDLTLTSLFVPLCSGGLIRVYPEDDSPADITVTSVVRDDQVDVVKLTPAHLAMVCDSGLKPARIRTLIVGGDNFDTALARRAKEVFGQGTRVINEYGPTEAVVGCMFHEFEPGRDTGPSVPIGVPADHAGIYLLDDGLNPVPGGVTGEIYIGGHGLASGYVDDPGQTQQRFISDPFNQGARMYRSGDLARLDDNGFLEYLGRRDQQVKIRGVRVEPAEVGAVLSRHEAVLDSHIGVLRANPVTASGPEVFCARCGISSRYPAIRFDRDGVCNICVEFESYRERAQAYFKPLGEFESTVRIHAARKAGEYDCLVLLSGGKDSTYALYQVAATGVSVLAMTLDNGYISDTAKSNIRRVVEDLGIDHEFVTTPHMNKIFADSLERHSSVCYGCFKTIYTLAINLAHEKGIPCIVTGLSRGQFFETRLVAQVFEGPCFDPDEIDRQVLETRKVYHRLPDEVTASIDMSLFEDDNIFEQVQFIDFYRYCDTSVEEIYDFLDHHVPWLRPEDTGRSTNCLINDTGIHVHKETRGYHNYALPYSWDVRLGHKQRGEALRELNDDIDTEKVREILGQVGYDDQLMVNASESSRLVAYYVARHDLDESELQGYISESLPRAMVPDAFVRMDKLPLNQNGKVDISRLPEPDALTRSSESMDPPVTSLEKQLEIRWCAVLGLRNVGRKENFFELGGDSIVAIQLVSQCSAEGFIFTPNELFLHQTIAELSEFLEGRISAQTTEPETESESASRADMLQDLDQGQLDKISRMLER